MKITAFFVAVAFFTLALSKTLIGVADIWPPYEYIEEINGKYYEYGADYEIIKAVLKKMGYDLKVSWLPWIRCLKYMKEKKADVIFSAYKTEERSKFLIYPEEPINYGPIGLFYEKERKFEYQKLEDLKGYKVAYVRSYYYGEDIFKLPFFFVPVNDVPTGLRLLLVRRIDFVIANLNVGMFWTKKLSIEDKITYLDDVILGVYPLYAAFSKKEGHEDLAKKFSKILREFKKSKDYYIILKRYGILYYNNK